MDLEVIGMSARDLKTAIIAVIVLSAIHGTPSLILGMVKGACMVCLIGIYIADRMHT